MNLLLYEIKQNMLWWFSVLIHSIKTEQDVDSSDDRNLLGDKKKWHSYWLNRKKLTCQLHSACSQILILFYFINLSIIFVWNYWVHLFIILNFLVFLPSLKGFYLYIISYIYIYICTPIKMHMFGVPVVVQWLMNPPRNHEVAGSIPALA